MLRFAFDDPREIGPLLPGVEDEMEDFYDGIQPYTFDDFRGDLMRVTSGQTDPVHRHDKGEFFIITMGEMWLDGAKTGPGGVAFIPANTDYAVRAGDEGVRYFRVVVC